VKMLALKVLALLLCIYGTFGQNQMYSTPYPCVAYYGSNTQADLSPLMNYADYVIYNGTQVFWLNMCRAVITTNCGGSVGGCYQPYIYSSSFVSMGSASSMYFSWATQYSGSYGLSAIYNGGLYSNYVSSNMQIDFTCSPGAGVGTPSYVGQNSTTGTYYFAWSTQYACFAYSAPNTYTNVSGAPIFIIFGVLAILFCIAGCCVHMCKRRRQREMMKRRVQAVDIPMDNYPAVPRQVTPTPQPQQQQLQVQQPYPYMPVYPVQYYPGAPMTSVPMGSPYPQYYVPSYTAIPQHEPQQMVPQVQLDKLDE